MTKNIYRGLGYVENDLRHMCSSFNNIYLCNSHFYFESYFIYSDSHTRSYKSIIYATLMVF